MRIDAIPRCRWLTVWCWCAASAFAQVPAEQESGVGGLRLRSSRSAETWQLELSRAGFTPDGVSRLKPLLEQARDQFLTGDGVSVTGGQLVEQWLAAAPIEHWQRWDTSIRNESRLAWKRWEETRDEAVLRDFLQSYGASRQGLIGWKTVVRLAMDEARWNHAAAGLEHVLHHRAASPDDRAQAITELIALRVRQDRLRDAQALATSQIEILRGKSIRWEGTVQSTEAVLSRLLSDQPPPAPTVSERPTVSAHASKPIPLPKELQEYWPEWRRDYRAEGAWLNPAAEPLLVGELLIVQTISGLEAVKIAGKSDGWRVRHDDWRRMLEQAEKWGSREWRGQLLDQLVRRESADSILGRISTDGQRVFAISSGAGSEMDRLIPGKNTPAGPRDDTAGQALVENRLSAYDVKTGELLWQAGGPSAGPTYPFARMFFCGPPCVVDGTLYLVAQQETELQLIAMDAARGERLWSTTLGDVPRSLSSDPIRQRTACPVVWDDGVLIATTANGAVIAVDALTHAARWAYRYPTTPRETVLRPREQNNNNFQPDPWWDAWRDARLFTAGNSIVFVSPESQRLHGIDRRTGVAQWTAAREGALWLTGADNQQVYVAGPHHLAAWKLADGQPAWKTSIPDSGGRPLLMPTEILQPLANQHLARIALADGSLQLIRGGENPVMGNLITNGQHWGSINGDAILHWQTAEENAMAIRAREQADPTDVVPRIETARLKLDAGDRQGARAALPNVQSPPEALMQTARQITLADLAAEPASWRDKVAELPKGVFTDESFELAEAIVAAARKNGDLVDAGRLILPWLEQPVQNETVLASGVRRTVRVDLACLGLWDDVWRQADASQRAALTPLLEDVWQNAENGNDPFAIARLLELWHPLPIARRKAQQAHERHFLGRSFTAVELQLLSLAAASGPDASRLWLRLAREQSQAGFPHAAASALAHAKQLDPQMTVDPALDLTVPSRPAWPAKSPLMESQHERNDQVQQSAVPLDLDTSAFFDDLDVSVDRQYQRVTFTSREQPRTWNLPLTKASSSMRYTAHLLMGWGRGRVLLLRVGSELFAIAPFDERDEPVARILWTVDMLTGSMVLGDHARQETLPVMPGIREEDSYWVSAFGRKIGQVGPVCAGFVCFHEKGKLVSLETFTGRKRWERHGLPFDARTFGDEEHVLVWSPGQQAVEILRAFDGKLLETRSWEAHPDRIILLQDTRAYRLMPQPVGWQLRCEDVVTGRLIWSHDAPAGASPVVLDRDVIGVAEPGGQLRFLSLSDGRELAMPVTFLPMPQLERAIVSRDADTWYVAISNRVSRQAALQPANNRFSHRTPTVDGPLIAIDRRSFQPRWQFTLTRSPWLLDQPRTAPLLLQAYKLGTADQIANGFTNGVIRLLDKRTGAEVLHREGANLLGFATFQSNPDRGLVEVRLEQETIRLRYHPHPPAPASPEP